MNLYDMFKTDEKHESNGIELDYGDCQIRIARAGGSNKKYGDLLSKRLKPYRRQMDTGTMDNTVAEKILAEVYAETVIIGWTNVKDREGNVMKFTKENCVKLLLDLPELFRDIQEQASKVANFREAEIEEDTKN